MKTSTFNSDLEFFWAAQHHDNGNCVAHLSISAHVDSSPLLTCDTTNMGNRILRVRFKPNTARCQSGRRWDDCYSDSFHDRLPPPRTEIVLLWILLLALPTTRQLNQEALFCRQDNSKPSHRNAHWIFSWKFWISDPMCERAVESPNSDASCKNNAIG